MKPIASAEEKKGYTFTNNCTNVYYIFKCKSICNWSVTTSNSEILIHINKTLSVQALKSLFRRATTW